MKNEPIFSWDAQEGVASCILSDGYNTFVGTATCHNEDADMKNEKTGMEIAFQRAQINALCHLRDNQIKPELAAYKQLYYSMNQSSHFSPNSYENKMLQRKIREKEEDLATTNKMIATDRKNLRNYIQDKEKFYQHIRKNRQKAKTN